jgi:hypothetical protein
MRYCLFSVGAALALILMGPLSEATAQGLPDLGIGGGGGANIELPNIGGGDSGSSGVLGVDPGISLPGPQLPASTPVTLDQSAAVKAVQDRRALPLNDLLKAVAKTNAGEVIDVQLLRANNALFYEVKLLDGRGRVTVAYFQAATGKPVAAPR